MKGYRFYAAMPEARKTKRAKADGSQIAWTVGALKRESESGYGQFRADLVALMLDDNGRPYWQGNTQNMDAVTTAIEANPHSYGYASVSRDYLAARCVRVPESLARQLSPELFRYLG